MNLKVIHGSLSLRCSVGMRVQHTIISYRHNSKEAPQSSIPPCSIHTLQPLLLAITVATLRVITLRRLCIHHQGTRQVKVSPQSTPSKMIHTCLQLAHHRYGSGNRFGVWNLIWVVTFFPTKTAPKVLFQVEQGQVISKNCLVQDITPGTWFGCHQ